MGGLAGDRRSSFAGDAADRDRHLRVRG
jgi:hypothetical protein